MAVDVDADALKGQGQGQGQCKIDLDLYVATDGDDTNDGLTPATAFATVHRAVGYLREICFKRATVHIADGSYSGDTLYIKDQSGQVTLRGESRTGTFLNFGIIVYRTSHVIVENITEVTDTVISGNIVSLSSSNVTLLNVDIENNVSSTFTVGAEAGGNIILGGINFRGTASSFLHVTRSSSMIVSGDISFNGTCGFGAIYVAESGSAYITAELTGYVTGKKYTVISNGVLAMSGSGVFPGSKAGTTATGGVVV
jgi:hypothetical protein